MPVRIEGLFGEAKQNHGLRRSRYRGLSKVQIQFYLIAIALNCKRVVNRTIILLQITLLFIGMQALLMQHRKNASAAKLQTALA